MQRYHRLPKAFFPRKQYQSVRTTRRKLRQLALVIAQVGADWTFSSRLALDGPFDGTATGLHSGRKLFREA